MRALQAQAKRKWGGEIVPQYSPKGRSPANGVAETAIQEIEAQIRTMIFALESRIQVRLQIDAPIIFWLIEYAAELVNRVRKQERDGLTSYQRKHGRPDHLAWAEFGEVVHYMPLGNTVHDDRDRRLAKADPKMEVGVYLGTERDSNECRIRAPYGVIRR